MLNKRTRKIVIQFVAPFSLVICFLALWFDIFSAHDRSIHSSPGITILCWVVTQPANQFKAKMVEETWGRKCDKLLFISSQNDSSLPAIGFPIVEESRSQLWNKAKFTFTYIYESYLNDYDWFLKADDDTYVIMENLRVYVASKDSNLPWFLGRRFKMPAWNVESYLTGGPGYLLTRATVRLLVESGLDDGPCDSTLPGQADDVILGQCLEMLGAIVDDTRDRHGLQRFINYSPEDMFNERSKAATVIKEHDFYRPVLGRDSCSDQPISFHYISGYQMQLFEYLLYGVKIAK